MLVAEKGRVNIGNDVAELVCSNYKRKLIILSKTFLEIDKIYINRFIYINYYVFCGVICRSCILESESSRFGVLEIKPYPKQAKRRGKKMQKKLMEGNCKGNKKIKKSFSLFPPSSAKID